MENSQFTSVQQKLNFDLNIDSSKHLLTGDYLGALKLLESIDTEELKNIQSRCKFLLKARYTRRLSDNQRSTINTKISIIDKIIDIRESILKH